MFVFFEWSDCINVLFMSDTSYQNDFLALAAQNILILARKFQEKHIKAKGVNIDRKKLACLETIQIDVPGGAVWRLGSNVPIIELPIYYSIFHNFSSPMKICSITSLFWKSFRRCIRTILTWLLKVSRMQPERPFDIMNGESNVFKVWNRRGFCNFWSPTTSIRP